MKASNTQTTNILESTAEADAEAAAEAQVRSALRDCFDSSLPCNIVDLGLVHSVTLTHDPEAPGTNIPGVLPKYRIAITLTPSTQDDTASAHLTAQVQNRLAGLEQVLHTAVTLLDTPAWTPQRITPAGRRTLGLEGNPNLIQISGAR